MVQKSLLHINSFVNGCNVGNFQFGLEDIFDGIGANIIHMSDSHQKLGNLMVMSDGCFWGNWEIKAVSDVCFRR